MNSYDILQIILHIVGNIFTYLLDLLRVLLVWPVAIFLILISFKDNIGKFIDEIAEVKWGDKGATRKGVQDVEKVEIAQDESDGIGAKEDFTYLESFFVVNTKKALVWFFNQKEGASLDSFQADFNLPVPENRNDEAQAKEKMVIFGVLVQQNMIFGNEKGLFKVTKRGERFLSYIKEISK